jgi:hypothetical protein
MILGDARSTGGLANGCRFSYLRSRSTDLHHQAVTWRATYDNGHLVARRQRTMV